jgi:predicted TIM-barrel enzyme
MTNRDELLARFRARTRPLIGAGAGTGLSGKAAVAGGADFLVVYNSGRYRMAGRGSLAGLLAYGDANEIVLDMAGEIVPVSKAPVLAGVNGTDPFRPMPRFLADLKSAGYQGVQNFPTVGAFDGVFRENLEGTGMGYTLEVEMMRLAGELDLLTVPYCFTPEEACAMVDDADVDIVVAHMGLTTSGSIGATAAIALDEAAAACQKILDEARRRKPDVLVLAHGGPIATPADWQYVLDRTEGLDGFLGASSMERLPAEAAIRATVEEFTAIARVGA